MRDVQLRLSSEVEDRFDACFNAYMNSCRVHDLPVRVSKLPDTTGSFRSIRFLSQQAAHQFSSWWDAASAQAGATAGREAAVA